MRENVRSLGPLGVLRHGQSWAGSMVGTWSEGEVTRIELCLSIVSEESGTDRSSVNGQKIKIGSLPACQRLVHAVVAHERT